MNINAKLITLIRSREGVAAIEMGLVTPIVVIGFLLMADLGMALGERMDLDRYVRAGAQAVMSLVTEPTEVKDLVLASSDGAKDVTVTVDKSCSCGSTATGCTSLCSAQAPPSVFINISATKPYSGFMLPAFTLESRTHVQVR